MALPQPDTHTLQTYDIHMEPMFDMLQLIDVPRLVSECKEKWHNQTLCKVNNQLVRLGIFNEGEFHWHKHDNEDEFFFVLFGELFIEFEGDAITLKPHQGITVPKNVLHRPYVKQPTAVLMVESESVTPTGNP